MEAEMHGVEGQTGTEGGATAAGRQSALGAPREVEDLPGANEATPTQNGDAGPQRR